MEGQIYNKRSYLLHSQCDFDGCDSHSYRLPIQALFKYWNQGPAWRSLVSSFRIAGRRLEFSIYHWYICDRWQDLSTELCQHIQEKVAWYYSILLGWCYNNRVWHCQYKCLMYGICAIQIKHWDESFWWKNNMREVKWSKLLTCHAGRHRDTRMPWSVYTMLLEHFTTKYYMCASWIQRRTLSNYFPWCWGCRAIRNYWWRK